MDSLSIGSAPHGEDCVQVDSSGDYVSAMRAECARYRELLRKVYGEEPEGARLVIKGNPHDFGTYYEVECKYDENNESAVEYAFKVENGVENWQ